MKINIFFFIIQIIFWLLLASGIAMAFFQTYSYKKRQQKIYFDADIFIEFFICLCSHVANVLFIIATTLTLYIYLMLKTQSTISVLPPISQQPMIKFLFVMAFLLKVG